MSRDLCFYFKKRPLYGLWASFLMKWTEDLAKKFSFKSTKQNIFRYIGFKHKINFLTNLEHILNCPAWMQNVGWLKTRVQSILELLNRLKKIPHLQSTWIKAAMSNTFFFNAVESFLFWFYDCTLELQSLNYITQPFTRLFHQNKTEKVQSKTARKVCDREIPMIWINDTKNCVE